MRGRNLDALEASVSAAILSGMVPHQMEDGPARLALADAARLHAKAATPAILNHIEEAERRGAHFAAAAVAIALSDLRARIKSKYGYAYKSVTVARSIPRALRNIIERHEDHPADLWDGPTKLAEYLLGKLRLDQIDDVSAESLKNLFSIHVRTCVPCKSGKCLVEQLGLPGTDSGPHLRSVM